MCSLLLEQTSLLKEISMSCSKLNVCRWQHIHLVSILKDRYQQPTLKPFVNLFPSDKGCIRSSKKKIMKILELTRKYIPIMSESIWNSKLDRNKCYMLSIYCLEFWCGCIFEFSCKETISNSYQYYL